MRNEALRRKQRLRFETLEASLMIALRRKHKPFWGMKLWDESRDKLYRGRASRDEEWSSVMIAWWGFQRWLLCRGVFSCMCVYMYVYIEWGSVFRDQRASPSVFVVFSVKNCVRDIWGRVFVYVYVEWGSRRLRKRGKT